MLFGEYICVNVCLCAEVSYFARSDRGELPKVKNNSPCSDKVHDGTHIKVKHPIYPPSRPTNALTKRIYEGPQEQSWVSFFIILYVRWYEHIQKYQFSATVDSNIHCLIWVCILISASAQECVRSYTLQSRSWCPRSMPLWSHKLLCLRCNANVITGHDSRYPHESHAC